MDNKVILIRVIGAAVLLFNLWLIGHYNLEGGTVLLLTFGLVLFLELVVVKKLKRKQADQ